MLHIAFWHPKGGVGKTTLALNLAGYLHSQGKSVQVCDLDPQQSAVWIAGIRPDGLGFLVMAGLPAQQPDVDFLITDHPPRLENLPFGGVVVLPSGAVAHELAALTKALREMDARHATLPVVTRFNRQRAAQTSALQKVPEMARAPRIADRSVYQRFVDEGRHIFDPAMDRLYGVREARAEIAELFERIMGVTRK